MTMSDTKHWIDLYGMILDKLAEHLADPVKAQEHFHIKPNEEGSIQLGPLNMEKYKELRDSWTRVSRDLRIFGLSDDLMLDPMPEVMAKPKWLKAPYLNVSRPQEYAPIKFIGRDALTAFNFINFYIQHCESLNPKLHVRRTLEAQGITKENFSAHQHLLGISNPWEDDIPSPFSSN